MVAVSFLGARESFSLSLPRMRNKVILAYLEFVLLAIDNHRCDLLIHEDEYGGEERRQNGCEPHVRRILGERIDHPAAAFFRRGELSRHDQFWCIETDHVIERDIGKDGQDNAEVAHFRTDLKRDVLTSRLLHERAIRTVMGKNRLNLKFFNVYARMNVEKKRRMEKKKTSGM